ncbi:MAG: putative tricarboxylic transport membrane protein [Parasphingorhabdus sp.]|jgi:putative tricarboxylic transport membrane protein
MFINADRISGLFFLVFGLLLAIWIIPVYVDSSEDSWVSPDTIPYAVAVVISIGGLLLLIKPTNFQAENSKVFFRAGFFLMILALGLYVMSLLGFIYTAPVIALILMLVIGERRPLWLLAGVAGMPLVIWFLVERALERALP